MNKPETSTDESLVEQLAEEYLSRLQSGERPSIRQYTQDHPELADEIRDLFNTLVMMEDLAPDPDDIADQSAPWTNETPESLGEYQILRELGRGGMGVVYEAEHTSLRRRVALKVLYKRAAKRGHDLERFMREARSAGRLHHTNIVPVFEVGADDGIHFYAMQCIRGQNLDLIIADLKRIHEAHPHEVPHAPSDQSPSAAYNLLTGQFTRQDIDAATVSNVFNESPGEQPNVEKPPQQADSSSSNSFTNIIIPDSSDMSNVGAKKENYFHRVARIGLQVADALAYAHDQGVLHRDIKPANLILDTTGVVWVTDFGLARSEGEDLTHTGDIVGTLRYMAPERFQGEADARADIYSLGLTLYELCTLNYAFDRSDRADLIRQVTQQDPTRPRLVNASIPSDLETIVLKSIDREPDARYRSAGEMAEDLRLFLADRPIQARRASFAEQTWRWCRRNPSFASMLASIAMLLAVVFCGAIGFAITAQNHATEIEQKSRTIEAANLQGKRSLFDSYVGQARASRWSGRRGQRYGTLNAVRSAAELLPKLGFDADRIRREELLLRNEVIAALPLADIQITHSWPADGTNLCALSKDGLLLATPEKSGVITVREIDTDRTIARLDGGTGYAPYCMKIDPQSRFIAAWFHDVSTGQRRSMVVWEIAKHSPVLELKKNLGRAYFGFDQTGDRFALLRGNGRIDIFSSANMQVVESIQADPNARGVQFAPNGDLAVAIGLEVKFYASDGKIVDRTVEFPAEPRSIDFVGDGDLVVGCIDSMIYLHDSESGEIRSFEGHTGVVVNTNPSSDGRFLASAAWGGTRLLRELPSGQIRLRLDGLDFGWGGFCRQRDRTAFTEPMSRHGVWEVATGGPYREIHAESIQGIQGIIQHPHDDSIVVVAGINLEVWDFVRQRRLAVIDDIQASDAVFSPDGRTLYYGAVGKTTPQHCSFERIDDPSSDQSFVRLGPSKSVPGLNVSRPGGRGQHLAIDRAGTRLAAFASDGEVRIVDLTAKQESVNISAQRLASRLAISPNGKLLVTGTWHGRGVRISNVDTGERIDDLNTELRSAFVRFSPHGKWLIASGEEQDHRWDTSTWQSSIISGDIPDGGASKIAFSPDSQLAAIAHSSFVRRLIDPNSGNVVAVLESPDPATTLTTFSASGRYLVEAANGRIQVWDLFALRDELRELGLDWN